MPGDPLALVTAGDPLPNRADTFNEVFAAARNFRAKKRAGQNAVTTTPERFSPAHVITVVNSTGGTLPIFSVVELRDTLESLTSDYLTISSRPAVEGISPTATTAPFAILLDGVANGGLVRAVVGGCAVVDIDITASSHEYATPKVSTTANLTSAASGPVRILERETGSSGVKRACVLVTQSGHFQLPAKTTDYAVLSYGVASDVTDVPRWLSSPSVNTWVARTSAVCGVPEEIDGNLFFYNLTNDKYLRLIASTLTEQQTVTLPATAPTSTGMVLKNGVVTTGSYATGWDFVDAAEVTYTPTTSADWTGADPTTVQEALDRIAAALSPVA
jgi:hypothetical protein